MSLIPAPQKISNIIPGTWLFNFQDLTKVYDIVNDGSSPQQIAKILLEFPPGNDGISPLIIWAQNILTVTKIANFHTSTIQFLSSSDDITYSQMFLSQAGFDANGPITDLVENLSTQAILNNKLYCKIQAFIGVAGLDHIQISKINWQMLMAYPTQPKITRIA